MSDTEGQHASGGASGMEVDTDPAQEPVEQEEPADADPGLKETKFLIEPGSGEVADAKNWGIPYVQSDPPRFLLLSGDRPHAPIFGLDLTRVRHVYNKGADLHLEMTLPADPRAPDAPADGIQEIVITIAKEPKGLFWDRGLNGKRTAAEAIADAIRATRPEMATSLDVTPEIATFLDVKLVSPSPMRTGFAITTGGFELRNRFGLSRIRWEDVKQVFAAPVERDQTSYLVIWLSSKPQIGSNASSILVFETDATPRMGEFVTKLRADWQNLLPKSRHIAAAMQHGPSQEPTTLGARVITEGRSKGMVGLTGPSLDTIMVRLLEDASGRAFNAGEPAGRQFVFRDPFTRREVCTLPAKLHQGRGQLCFGATHIFFLPRPPMIIPISKIRMIRLVADVASATMLQVVITTVAGESTTDHTFGEVQNIQPAITALRAFCRAREIKFKTFDDPPTDEDEDETDESDTDFDGSDDSSEASSDASSGEDEADAPPKEKKKDKKKERKGKKSKKEKKPKKEKKSKKE